MRTSPWRRFVAACSLLLVAFALLHPHPAAQAWIYLGVSLAEFGAVFVGLRRNALGRNAVWLLLAASLIPHVAGNVLWYGSPVLLHRPLPFPSVSDWLFIPSYVLQLAALVLLIGRTGQKDRGESLEAAITAFGAFLIIWVLTIEPALADSHLTTIGRVVTLSYPMFDIALAAIAARMFVGGRRRVVSFWLIGASVLVQFAADLGYSTSALRGTFRYGGWVCAAYVLAFLLLGAAALHPSARSVTTTELAAGPVRRLPRVILLGLAAAIGPCLLLLPSVRDDVDVRAMVVAGSLVLIALTLTRLSGLMIDVEAYRRAQLRLRDAEVRYRSLVEQMPGVVYIAEFGEQGDWIYVSPKINELLGYTMEEWFAHDSPWGTHVHPDDRPRAVEEENESGRLGIPLSSVYRMFARDGRMLWIHDTATLVPDEHGVPRYWQGVMTDITGVKETEHRLRAAAEERRELLARLVQAQEEERLRVANDIHDDPIQHMTAVGMRLAMLRSKLPPELRQTADDLDRAVSRSIGRLRRLMFELRPMSLDRDGLEPALRQYLTVMQQEHGPAFEIANRMVGEPSADARAAAYRVAQEALVNVRKHAAAAMVRIVLEERERGFLVRIEDDGAGFTPGSARSDGHMGLTAMRERAELAGGWCRIASAPGEGTTVEFWLPDPQRDGAGLPLHTSAG